MKKNLLTLLTLASLCVTPLARAEQAPLPVQHADVTPEEFKADADVTPVGEASSESARTARNKQWFNIAVAIGVVAAAITAAILVANHHHNHHD